VSQGGEVLSSLPIGFSVQSSYKVNDVTSGITFCKAMPEVFRKADHKGSWIVTPMHRTGAEKLISSFIEVRAQALVVQYRLNGNGTFKILKIQ
jgi:hypothetical protein